MIPYLKETSQRFIAVDVETTGLSTRKGDRIIEIGAVVVRSLNITEEFSSLVDSGVPIPASSRQVHGITEDMLFGQPKPEEAFYKFKCFIGDTILVAHNARFDMGFLRNEYNRLGLRLANRTACTLKMSRKFFPSLVNHRLETVYSHLFGPVPRDIKRHRALSDARLAAKIWIAFHKHHQVT